MNAGFEDGLVFYNFLEQFDNDLQKAAIQYSETRWKDSYAIADLSFYNYMEMRAHINSSIFLLCKYVDNILHALFPMTIYNGSIHKTSLYTTLVSREIMHRRASSTGWHCFYLFHLLVYLAMLFFNIYMLSWTFEFLLQLQSNGSSPAVLNLFVE